MARKRNKKTSFKALKVFAYIIICHFVLASICVAIITVIDYISYLFQTHFIISIVVLVIVCLLFILSIFLFVRRKIQRKKINTYYNIDDELYKIDYFSGEQFEDWCACLLSNLGYRNIQKTKSSGDQGADLIAIYNGEKYAVQCKRYNGKLGNKPIQEVLAAKYYYNCDYAFVMTNSFFTDGALSISGSTGVGLWNRNRLIMMMEQVNEYTYLESIKRKKAEKSESNN